jgi:transcriptional regulator with XRE-family HTH domain
VQNCPVSSRELAQFLRTRRAALQPGEYGLGQRTRRRTAGLRREDVAALASVSADYYRRLEQARIGPPSAQVVAALVRALRLTADERDYLYRITDRVPLPVPAHRAEVEPALRQVVDGLGASPAAVLSVLGDVLLQNAAGAALMGDASGLTGDDRNSTYRWFTDPAARAMHPGEEHEEEGRSRVAELRARAVRVGDPRADRLIGLLRARSAEFERYWLEHKVAICRSGVKTMINPRTGPIDLDVQILEQAAAGQLLVVFTARAGTRAEHLLGRLTNGSRFPAGTALANGPTTAAR